MKNQLRRVTSAVLAGVLCAGTVFPTTAFARSKEESDVFAGTADYHYEEELGDNQPWVHSYRIDSLLDWSSETDRYADYNRALIPLQERNEKYTATQANPNLTAEAELLVLAGDYQTGQDDMWNAGSLSAYGDTFARYCFNFWQYMDYYGTWHGEHTENVPDEILDIHSNSIMVNFEYGAIMLPNPGYTNAAHKNGVKSIAVIGLPKADENYKPLLTQDEDGHFPYAQKLAEIKNFYGFDGYFINQERDVAVADIPTYKLFLKELRDLGCYVQWYDAIDNDTGSVSYQNEFNATNSPFIIEGETRYSDSIFLNYWWNQSKLTNSKAHADSLGVDPLSTVFVGVEGGMNRWNQPYDIAYNKDENGQPMNGIAIIGADMPNDVGTDADGVYRNKYLNENQWKIFERERIWWSGPNEDPTNTGRTGLIRTDLGIGQKGASNWDGFADQIIEKSVINGSNFHTNFNTGHGLNYYLNGEAAGVGEWNNIIIQDILPTWQWWFDSEGTKLTADFDYGEGYEKGTQYSYQTVNPYKGADSLVVSGKLDAENFLHLYKSDLSVNENSKASVTFKKVSNDSAVMKLGLIFKDSDEVVKVDIPNTAAVSEGWTTEEIDLSAYAGKTIAAIGFVFEGESDFYQMNVGELKITDGSVAVPEAPTGLKIDKAYTSGEMTISWDMAPYDEVKQYNVYAVKDGKEVYLGGTYDEVFYINDVNKAIAEAEKTTVESVTVSPKEVNAVAGDTVDFDAKVNGIKEEDGQITIVLKAVSADGTESEGAATSHNYKDSVQNVEVKAEDGKLNVTWEGGKADVVVTTEYEKEARVWTASGENGCTVDVASGAEADGARYTMTITTPEGAAVTYDGQLDDSYCAPFDRKISGGYIDFPKVKDWWKMTYSTVTDGVESEETTATRFITIDHDKMPSISKDADTVKITLSDYRGNVSETVEVKNSPSVIITTDVSSVQAGTQVQFEAVVKNYTESDAVVWSISGQKAAGTTINENGLLTVDEEEPAAEASSWYGGGITITATSVEDPATFESKSVSVQAAYALQGDKDRVFPGDEVKFAVYYKGEPLPASNYDWSVAGEEWYGGITSSDTKVSADGTLTIGADETCRNLTVTATSKASSASFTASVSVSALYSIRPSWGSVSVGETKQFTIRNNKLAEDVPATEFNWSISRNNSADTKIDANGLVTIGADETCRSCNVTATHKTTGASCSTSLSVRAPSFSVSAASNSVTAGETVQMSASYKYSPTTEVNWSVSGNNSADTRIDANGLLTVASDETAASVTVTGTYKSNANLTRNVTITVKQQVSGVVSLSKSSIVKSSDIQTNTGNTWEDVEYMLDGDLTTKATAKGQNVLAGSTPNSYVIVDIGEANAQKGIVALDAYAALDKATPSNRFGAKTVKLSYSDTADGTYTEAATVELEAKEGYWDNESAYPNRVTFETPIKARYFKYEVVEWYGKKQERCHTGCA